MSAILPLQIAIDAAIQGDAVLSAKLKGEKVYSLSVPEEDDALPYVVFSQSSETPHRIFGGRGHDGIETLTVWSGDRTKFEAADIASDLERLLDAKPLTLNGHVLCTGVLRIVAIMLDPSGKYSQATCHYEPLSFEA